MGQTFKKVKQNTSSKTDIKKEKVPFYRALFAILPPIRGYFGEVCEIFFETIKVLCSSPVKVSHKILGCSQPKTL